MEYNPDKAAKLLVRIGKVFFDCLPDPNWTVIIEHGSLSPLSINVRQAFPAHLVIREMEYLFEVMPQVAFPAIFICQDGLVSLRLAGIKVSEPELSDVINDMCLIQKSLPVTWPDDHEVFCFGRTGMLQPDYAEATIVAHSPIEAVMKFIITKVPIGEMNSMPLRNPEIDYRRYEMRSQKDWQPIPFADAYFFACKYLTATLVTQSLTRRVIA